jgi:hypothetical protein
MPEYVVYSSDDGLTESLWLADPIDPAARRALLAFSHRPAWSGVAVVSPQGRSIAYTVLPSSGRDPDRDAELRILDIQTQCTQTLEEGIDLRSTLVWSDDGLRIAYQRFIGSSQETLLQSLAGGGEESLDEAKADERLIPVAIQGGVLLEVLFDTNGATLEMKQDASRRDIQRLSDGGATRGFELSRDGKQLAYLATDAGNRGISRARVVAVDGSSARQLPADWGEIAGVAWNAGGKLVIGSTAASTGIRAVDGERLLSPMRPGFLQPLAWSPSGQFLAVRAFSGQSGSQPGDANDELLTSTGQLLPLSDSTNARFIGWTTIPSDSWLGR